MNMPVNRNSVLDIIYLLSTPVFAPTPGFEPGTYRLTVGRSAVELCGIVNPFYQKSEFLSILYDAEKIEIFKKI